MNLRRAKITDAAKICRTHKASIRGLCRSQYTPEQIEAWAEPKQQEHYEPLIRDLTVFVMEEDEDIVGFAVLDATAADIRALCVGPEVAGCGVGTKLLDALESEARRLGIPGLRASATLNAVGFYGARGYSSRGLGENVLPRASACRARTLRRDWLARLLSPHLVHATNHQNSDPNPRARPTAKTIEEFVRRANCNS